MTFSTRTGLIFLTAASLLSADTLRLKSGETIRGTYLGGTSREIRMDQAGSIRTYDVTQVDSVMFESSDQAPRATAQDPRRELMPPPSARDSNRDYSRNNSPVGSGRGITVPTGTEVSVRMIDSVNSETSRTGETFRASLDEAVVVDGRSVIPRGADVLMKLVSDQQSGKIQGRTVLTLALSTITVDGIPMDINSTDVQTASGSRGARSAKVIGGTAVLGAVIGAIAGGGKGAAIGAGSGAAVGTGAEVLTGGQKVKIPSETRLVFRLQAPLQL